MDAFEFKRVVGVGERDSARAFRDELNDLFNETRQPISRGKQAGQEVKSVSFGEQTTTIVRKDDDVTSLKAEFGHPSGRVVFTINFSDQANGVLGQVIFEQMKPGRKIELEDTYSITAISELKEGHDDLVVHAVLQLARGEYACEELVLVE